MSVPVTFTSKAKRASAIIPVFQDKIVEYTETFDVTIDIPSSLKHQISAGRKRKAVATIIDSTSKFSTGLLMCFIWFTLVISCPANFKVIAKQKTISSRVVRKEVRSTIKNVLHLSENITTDKEAFAKIAETIKVRNTTENFVKFQNAINEISEASFEACYGSNSSLVLPEETPVLIETFKVAAKNNKSTEARRIFGRLLCLKQKFQPNNITSILKRETDEIEMELNMWFNNLSPTNFPVLFFDDVGDNDEPTLAFVVDDTGSMRDEIDAVKELIKAIIKAEKFAPFFYILGTFNDPSNDINKYLIKYIIIKDSHSELHSQEK